MTIELSVVLYVTGFNIRKGDVLCVPSPVVGLFDIRCPLLDGMMVEAIEACGIHHPDGGLVDIL